MIRHLVFFSVRDRNDLPEVHATLWTLADIPGVRGFEVGVNQQLDPYANLTSGVSGSAQQPAPPDGMSQSADKPASSAGADETSQPVASTPGPVDLVVHALFDDEAALTAFREHPIYQRSVEHVRPRRELRIAVDYPIPVESTHQMP